MKYLLDANVFIQARRFYYPMDVFPGFWDWLEQENDTGNIASTMMVRDELTDDELSAWVKQRDKERWFLSEDDEDTQIVYPEIANWVQHTAKQQKKRANALPDFLSGADSWLIAKAKAMGVAIVTQEKSEIKDRKKFRIPDVCEAFDVFCINTIEMIRDLGGKF